VPSQPYLPHIVSSFRVEVSSTMGSGPAHGVLPSPRAGCSLRCWHVLRLFLITAGELGAWAFLQQPWHLWASYRLARTALLRPWQAWEGCIVEALRLGPKQARGSKLQLLLLPCTYSEPGEGCTAGRGRSWGRVQVVAETSGCPRNRCWHHNRKPCLPRTSADSWKRGARIL
jgi:hypothetical protein